MAQTKETVALGLRANWAQFTLLVVVNAFVGSMVGVERAILPLLAEHDFGIASRAAALSFIASFGAVKALTNLFAGRLSDRIGRKPVLVAGWLAGLPVPLLIIAAPTWGWVVAANVLLGLNQGLAWSMTVTMKIDLVGPRRRGLAMGLNEAAGYGAVALAAFGASAIAAATAIRPWPFALALGCALAGLVLSVGFVHETQRYAAREASDMSLSHPDSAVASVGQLLVMSVRQPAFFAFCQAGLVNNLNDGMAWGLLPLYFAARGLGLETIGGLAALYPAVWGIGQLFTGALSDHVGRVGLIAGGMAVQALGIGLILLTHTVAGWAIAMVLLGVGTAMVYPTLLAAVSDVAHPLWRASAVGIYRLWRDAGYPIGVLLTGIVADTFGARTGIAVVGLLTAASGLASLLGSRSSHH